MNGFGRIFRIGIFGESHGPAVGVIVDGCPPGIPLSTDDLERDLARRRSGVVGTTERREADVPEILSGLYQGRTTGSPICIVFRNSDTRSSDYEAFKQIPRPGHADFTSRVKYGGFSDPRGSGHFSGRVTAGLVAAGAIAKKVIAVNIPDSGDRAAGSLRDRAQLASAEVGSGDRAAAAEAHAEASSVPLAFGRLAFETRVLEAGGSADIPAAAAAAKEAGDSIGGLVEIRVRALSPGLGEPFFDAAESVIAHAVFAVPGVRGLEFGDGFAASRMRGTEHNDPFISRDGKTSKNGSGGVNGGITNGNELVLRVAVKPASTISAPQRTLDFESGEEATLAPGGRHDACIALRAAVVLEAAVAVALADLSLISRATNARTEEA